MENMSVKKLVSGIVEQREFFFLLLLLSSILIFSNSAYAEDLFAGTDGTIRDTMKGNLKKYILLIDFAISLGAFWYTKKVGVLFSVAVLAIAITVMLKLIGFA